MADDTGEQSEGAASSDLETAVAAFLTEADSALSEYEQGYTDADAIVRQLEVAITDLRQAAERDE